MVIKVNGCKHLWPEASVDGAYTCLLCSAIATRDLMKDPFKQGELTVIKPGKEDWSKMSNYKRRDWHHRNSQQILSDIQRMGEIKTREKWQMPASTWTGLMKRWKLRAVEHLSESPERSKTIMPAFPVFSDDWSPEVQLKWLETYKILIEGRGVTQ